MPKGGRRQGAGRKPGSVNKRSQAALDEATRLGVNPLAFLLERVKDEQEERETRVECAKALLPYLHPRLASVDVDLSTELFGDVSINIKGPKEAGTGAGK